MRQLLRSRLPVLEKQGTDQIGYFTFPFSPAHRMPPGGEDEASWGGSIAFVHANAQMGVWPEGETPPVLVLETRRNGSFGHNSTYSEFSQADEWGEASHRDKECNRFVNWTGGEVRGLCYMSTSYLNNPSYQEVHARGWLNSKTETGPLIAPDEVSYSPVVANFMWLSIWASLAVTHPDMVNEYPRQQKRVSFITANVQGEKLAEIFNNSDLPPGSVLYCVDHNVWTGKTGTVVAFNNGRLSDFFKPEVTAEVPDPPLRVRPLHITEHTMVQGDATPSVIADHGTWVFEKDGNYTGVAAQTEKAFIPWVARDGTLYWTVTRPVRKGGLVLFINLLVPRSSVMDAIDNSTAKIREDFDAAKETANAQQHRSLMMLLLVTGVVVLVLLMMAVIFTRLITAPLDALAYEMAKVAVMDLEAVDRSRSVSRLAEVGNMQQSFLMMVQNLVEYRHYMPQSVLLNDTETEDCRETNSTSRSLSTIVINTSNCIDSKHNKKDEVMSFGSRRTPSTVSGSMSSSTRRALGLFTDVCSLKRKQVSVIAFNLKRWHRSIEGRTNAEILGRHADVVSILQDSVQGGKGVCDLFFGDRVIAVFNAYTVVSGHKQAAVCSAHRAWERIDSIKHLPALSFAVVSGDARVGHLGCSGMKRVTTLSPILPWVSALEHLNKTRYRGLVDQSLARDVSAMFDLKCVEGVSFKKRSPHPIKVYELTRRPIAVHAGAEWMYEVDALESASKFKYWNKTFDHIFEGEWAAAADNLAHIPASETDRDRLEDMIHNRKLVQVVIAFN
eukprot:TRINITY_DN50895_c0_g1_i1.p1 TRINITY_DN50895_c0_g1~~TRINITY_DN50895_c0_g1_i1.p1  ORF type:complete len:907 (+),score=357.23 TRINITY_DN50895_c0_g1_i1:373-2721(+)